MTKEEIIEMAKQAGFSSAVGKHIALDDDLERFAKLVAQHEREACAKVCDEPVAWKLGSSGIGGTGVIVQPQRTWVGLTDEDEIDWEDGGNLKDLVKAIEAKLKEKNT
jgi:hypothetical protein